VKGGIVMKNKKNKQTIENEPVLVEDMNDDLVEETTSKSKKTKKEKKVKVKQEKVPKEKKKKRIRNRAKFTSKFFKKFQGRSHDSFDQMLMNDYKHVVERAYQLSSINELDYDQMFIITVPDAFEKNGRVNYRLNKTADGGQTLLFDQSLVTILFFGSETLYYHQANVDHRDGHIAFDVSGEFSYFDVVHMETAFKYDNQDKPKYITLDLEVGLSDGVKVPFHLRNHRIHDDYHLPNLLTETEQKVLDTIKRRVRQTR
jgi:hypothetical protein